MRNEAGQEALLEKMLELKSKLHANELREKAALLKIQMLGKAANTCAHTVSTMFEYLYKRF